MKLVKRSSESRKDSRGWMLKEQSSLINSMNWKSPNACYRASVVKHRRRLRDGAEDVRP